MKLNFLGQSYESHTTEVAPTPSEIVGQYRGNLVTFSNSYPAPRTSVTLTYRGIRYTR
jgi:hypothetical protein